MRHAKDTYKLGRTGTHKRSMIANMLKSLLMCGRIETTIVKAKLLRSFADNLITLIKEDSLVGTRRAVSRLRVTRNKLTSKEKRAVKKKQDTSSYNDDRLVLKKLLELRQKYSERNGGYTRIIKKDFRVGDNAPTCYIEYV